MKESNKVTKDRIYNKDGLNVLIKHKGVNEPSRIFCDEIVYIHNRGIFQEPISKIKCKIFDHHLMFWKNRKLIFKVWLRNNPRNKEYHNINLALKDIGVMII